MKARVLISEFAWGQLQALLPHQQAQARRLIDAIQMAPGAGWPWNIDLRGRRHWIVSASDTHVVYRVAFRRRDNEIMITGVFVYETPTDPNNL